MTRAQQGDLIGVVLTGIGGLLICIAGWKACSEVARQNDIYRRAFEDTKVRTPTLPTWLHKRMPSWFLRWWYR